MALNIFERYGVKEVSNVTFEALADGRKGSAEEGVKKGDIVLYLDTLKVSTIEQTADNTEARGGWGQILGWLQKNLSNCWKVLKTNLLKKEAISFTVT